MENYLSMHINWCCRMIQHGYIRYNALCEKPVFIRIFADGNMNVFVRMYLPKHCDTSFIWDKKCIKWVNDNVLQINLDNTNDIQQNLLDKIVEHRLNIKIN